MSKSHDESVTFRHWEVCVCVRVRAYFRGKVCMCVCVGGAAEDVCCPMQLGFSPVRKHIGQCAPVLVYGLVFQNFL